MQTLCVVGVKLLHMIVIVLKSEEMQRKLNFRAQIQPPGLVESGNILPDVLPIQLVQFLAKLQEEIQSPIVPLKQMSDVAMFLYEKEILFHVFCFLIDYAHNFCFSFHFLDGFFNQQRRFSRNLDFRFHVFKQLQDIVLHWNV